MRRVWLTGIAVSLACAAPLTAAEERAQTIGEAKAKEQLQALAEIATLPIINAERASDVIQIAIRENDLVVATKLPFTDQAVVRAPGLAGVSRVRYSRNLIDPVRPPIDLFNFENVDYSVAGVVSVHTTVTQSPGKLTIVQDQDRMDDQVHSVQLIQTTGELGEADHRIMLYVQVTTPPEINRQYPADSVVELRRKFPSETSKYLDPIFRTLRMNGFLSRVDPRLAWQVFADAFVPPEKLQGDLKNVLAKLDADNFQDREAASRDLTALGQPAALALMKMDQKSLSDEQRGRIDAFVAQFRTVPPDQAEKYRRDADFLLDCLFADDEAIRVRALEQLRKLTGKSIEFDVSADEENRLAAIEKLRSVVGARPATQESVGLKAQSSAASP